VAARRRGTEVDRRSALTNIQRVNTNSIEALGVTNNHRLSMNEHGSAQ